jgi:hypothetical protein
MGILQSAAARKAVPAPAARSSAPFASDIGLPSDETAPRNPLILAGILAGSMLFVMFSVMLLIICLKGPGEATTEVTGPSIVAEVTETPLPPISPSPMPLKSTALKPQPLVGWAKSASSAGEPDPVRVKPRGTLLAVLTPPSSGNSGVDQAKIDQAVAKGVAFLKTGGTYRGYTAGVKALAGLTLLSCGVAPDDPAVSGAVATIRDMAGEVRNTYELALSVLFLDRLGEARDRDLIRRMALRLIAGQGVMGGWDYNCLPLAGGEEKDLLALLENPPPIVPKNPDARPRPKKPAFSSGLKTKPLPADRRVMKDLPVFQYQPDRKLVSQSGPYEDNSLTQFAILALWSAQKYGIPAERTLAMAEARFRDSQGPDGSWCYTWREVNRCKYSMTCAGLLGLAVGRGSEVRRTDKDGKMSNDDPAIEKALRFVSREIGTDHVAQWLKSKAGTYNDTASGWGGLYFLWSLERAAVVYGLRTIGGKDWYAWGAPIILEAQQPDGSWRDTFPGTPDTCFALLFLKRTNVVQDLTQKIHFLTMSKEAGERLRESEPVQDLSYGRRSELSGSVTPGRARGLVDD